MKVYFVDITTIDHITAIETGLRWLFQTAKEKDINSCIIAIPILDHINEGNDIFNTIEKLIPNLAKMLAKKREVQSDGISIKLVTQKTLSYLNKSIVLAIYPTNKYLIKLFDFGKNSDFFIVPWIIEELDDSLKMVEAENYFPKEKEETVQSEDLDPIVTEALKDLSTSVNLSTCLSHPSDKPKTKELFLILRKGGFFLDPDLITNWLVTEGNWNPRCMEEVRILIEKVNERKTLRFSTKYWKKELISILRKRIDS